MRRALLALTAIAATTVATTASADRSRALAAPRLFQADVAVPATLTASLFARRSILDLRSVQADPVMRARLEYSLMAALPVLHAASTAPLVDLSALQPDRWQVSRSLVITFPLAITGRNLVTAELVGKGELGLAPEGLGKGGVFTFKTAF